MSKILIKLNRISAWVLLLGMLVYFISGYGMTKGVINQDLATSLHTGWLTYIVLAAFSYHSAYAIYLFLQRHHLWGRSAKVGLTAVCSIFALLFVYIDKIYNNGSEPNTQVLGTATEDGEELDSSNRGDIDSATTVESDKSIFTASELAKYDGLNGHPAYVAINGSVYDVSSLYVNGTHRGCTAGKEITNAFYKAHVARTLSRFEVVGTYEG